VPREVLECEEFSEIQVRIDILVENGELKIDERVIGRGYLNVTLRGGQVALRADRHVGLIPLTDSLAVRVRPRTSIANLSYMIARSGVAPAAIRGFSRGYLPRFEVSEDLERTYAESLVLGAERIASRGLMKGYADVRNPPPWRGRLLPTETIRSYASRGIRYKHSFAFSTLSPSVVENQALLEALIVVKRSIEGDNRFNALLARTNKVIRGFDRVSRWHGSRSSLTTALGRKIKLVAPQLSFYKDALWSALLLLQRTLPDVTDEGLVRLDSLIIDVSKVFEAYTRRIIAERASGLGWHVKDGNVHPTSFFVDNRQYRVQPDIVIYRGRDALAVIDAKYKPNPKEADRYELLSFMDALGVQHGALLCPQLDAAKSTSMGVTTSGKQVSLLRFDLRADDPEAEADRLFENIRKLVAGQKGYI